VQRWIVDDDIDDKNDGDYDDVQNDDDVDDEKNRTDKTFKDTQYKMQQTKNIGKK